MSWRCRAVVRSIRAARNQALEVLQFGADRGGNIRADVVGRVWDGLKAKHASVCRVPLRWTLSYEPGLNFT